MENKTVVRIGELFRSFKFGWIIAFISPFSLALFTWVLTENNMIFREALILTIVFVVGTVLFSLAIQVAALATGDMLVSFGTHKKIIKKANIKFSVSKEKNQFYFLVQNKEFWNNVNKVKVLWDDIASNPDVPNEPFQKLKDWRVNRKALEWRLEKKDITQIPRRKSKDVLLFKIDKKENMFCIQAKDCDPIYFPVGEYIFFLSAVGEVPKKTAEYKIRIEFEYKGGNQYKISNAEIW